jgi:hypothetical protein
VVSPIGSAEIFAEGTAYTTTTTKWARYRQGIVSSRYRQAAFVFVRVHLGGLGRGWAACKRINVA